jgi:hypothetical protein
MAMSAAACARLGPSPMPAARHGQRRLGRLRSRCVSVQDVGPSELLYTYRQPSPTLPTWRACWLYPPPPRGVLRHSLQHTTIVSIAKPLNRPSLLDSALPDATPQSSSLRALVSKPKGCHLSLLLSCFCHQTRTGITTGLATPPPISTPQPRLIGRTYHHTHT